MCIDYAYMNWHRVTFDNTASLPIELLQFVYLGLCYYIVPVPSIPVHRVGIYLILLYCFNFSLGTRIRRISHSWHANRFEDAISFQKLKMNSDIGCTYDRQLYITQLTITLMLRDNTFSNRLHKKYVKKIPLTLIFNLFLYVILIVIFKG